MKECYVAPEAEVVQFVAQENLAFDDTTSFIGVDVTENQDGNADKWFD